MKHVRVQRFEVVLLPFAEQLQTIPKQ